MLIENAHYTDEAHKNVRFDLDGKTVFVTVGTGHRYEILLNTWIAEGNTVADYVPPVVPTLTAEEQAQADFQASLNSPFIQALLEETGQTQAILDKMVENAKLPEWDAAKTDYVHGDKVRHLGLVWVCLDDGTTSEPDWVPGDWEVA